MVMRDDWTALEKLIFLRGSGAVGGAAYDTISGNPVSFTARNAPLRKLEVAFSPVQSGSGDPSPDNVRPILGWDSLNVEQAQAEWKNVGGYWYAKTNYPTRLSLGELLPIEPNTSYTVTIAGNLRFAVQQYNNTDESQTTNAVLVDSGWRTETYTFTSHQNANYVWLLLSSPNYSFNITPADGYAQGLTMAGVYPTRSISISLGSTVYSGYVDVVTGDGLATDRKIVITSADSLYSYTQNSSGYYRARYYNYGNWFKNHSDGLYSVGLVTTASNSYNFASPNRFFTENTSVYVMPPSGITTEQTYKDWLDSIGGVEATVELKEPIPFHVNPQTINALAGENNVWSTANGDLTVTYRSN